MSSTSLIDENFEHARLAVLHSYAIVDTPPEAEFDDIVRQAAQECTVPMATLSMVDERRCWFKARVGYDVAELAREQSFCHYTIRSSGIFVVPDASQDPRFSQLPLVQQAGFHFYAGAPLIAPSGHPIGVLAVIDYQARELSTSERVSLQLLAQRAMVLIEQRRKKAAQPPLTSPPFPPSASAIGERSLLIVDDDDAVRSFVSVATRRLGYDVLLASNGVEALEQIDKHPGKIGLVLTDINMPLMDGLELVKALKKNPLSPPVAVMSGRFDPHVRSALRNQGVTALVSKPFSSEELKLTLLRALAAPAS